jgi:uncharacterized protein (TIGR03086 family)
VIDLSTSIADLDRPADELKRLLRAVSDDQLSARTPCKAYTVGDLLDHLMRLTIAFRNAATKSTGVGTSQENRPGPEDPSAANLHPEWRRRLPWQLDELVAAWRHPASWDGMTEVGGISLPSAMAGGFAFNELVLHGWDLARAVKLRFECDPAVAEASFRFTTEVIEQGFDGAYGPPIAAPDDAPTLDRLLCLAGRDPSWTP